jgi:hypothetical protein
LDIKKSTCELVLWQAFLINLEEVLPVDMLSGVFLVRWAVGSIPSASPFVSGEAKEKRLEACKYNVEVANITLEELEETRGLLGLPIARDKFFEPTALRDLMAKQR